MNSFEIGVASSLVAAAVWAVVSKPWAKKLPSQSATIQSPSGGTNVAVAGSVTTLNVHPPAEDAAAAFHARLRELEKQLEVITALKKIVLETKEHLRSIIAGAANWDRFGPGLHQLIEVKRGEYLAMRPQLASLHRPQEIALFDKWYDDLHDLGEGVVGTEAPVMKELQAYKVALNAGGSMVWTCDDIKGKIETALRS